MELKSSLQVIDSKAGWSGSTMSVQQAFFDSIINGDSEEIARLLDLHPDWINLKQDNYSPIMIALYNNKVQIAKMIWKRKPELNVFDACAIGDLETAKRLLDEKPELINEYSEDGYQPLNLAAYFGQSEIVDFLIRNYANVNAVSRNENRMAPIISAAARQHADIALMLLEAGADVNASENGGYTPLHIAAENGQVILVELFLEYGANPYAQMDDGRTPLDIARDAGHTEIIACFTGEWNISEGGTEISE
jgi:ankyrin repeat protein